MVAAAQKDRGESAGWIQIVKIIEREKKNEENRRFGELEKKKKKRLGEKRKGIFCAKRKLHC